MQGAIVSHPQRSATNFLWDRPCRAHSSWISRRMTYLLINLGQTLNATEENRSGRFWNISICLCGCSVVVLTCFFCLEGLILISSPLFVLFFSNVLSVVCRTQCQAWWSWRTLTYTKLSNQLSVLSSRSRKQVSRGAEGLTDGILQQLRMQSNECVVNC